ncbi:MAG TPA: TolC family protein [Candidatus Acidoferrales bacterium]
MNARRTLPTLLALLALLALGGALHAQQGAAAVDEQKAAAANGCQVTHADQTTNGASANPAIPPGASSGTPAAPVCLTLQDALDRARKYNPQFQSVVTAAAIAHQDSRQSLAGLLPTVTYNNQFIYTQPNQLNGVRFIANNTVHEYISQGNVHESIGVAEVADFRRVSATAAAAKAKAEIASRGLVVTVVQLYYALAAAEAKALAAQQTADQGDQFLKLTTNLEAGGEVAHSDTIKADLQVEDRRRQLKEAQLALVNARLDLAVILFPNFNTNFDLAEDLHAATPLPRLEEVQRQAARDNPDVRVALEAVRASGYDVTAARAGYLPSLGLDYFYGIDAPNFAARTQGLSNLGYSAIATLNIPIWNWGATQSKVKQAELRREQSKRELSYAQRKLLAEMQSLYTEAETAQNEQAGLERASKLAAESLRLTTLRYQNGEGTVLEVVDAQTAFATASAAYHDGAVRFRVALASLQTLTGVLPTP